ncbi:ABC transporter substrate-binding protein [Psychromonas sp. B3M02]|uniref:MlaC/ttg2D family ABC transporter substrate-binding protein n=1 Tax=Psychromonas sp. B3M02 TaxID=2267226 RepID=UPI000DEB075C|nr:ABC transporter substrate-binding protein [Psychromonas sp. B3M02]RBW42422.1 ABC transporter substrate-binding protein [Psychromonas sp. B3M02]
MRLFISIIALVYSLSFSVFAAETDTALTDPNQTLKTLSKQTFARLESERTKLAEHPEYIKVIINEELLPYFDYKYAAYSVVGANLKNTTAEQRNNFVDAFRTYLVNAYGHILIKYDEQTITILDNNNFKGKKIVNIPVRMRDNNGQVTQLSFKLRKNKKNGEWKVYDVIAEGISMLDTKRTEFGSLIQKQGIDEVIKLLLEKNDEFES